MRRKGSMDDLYIERLSKPTDHSALVKRIEKEQRIEFLKTRPEHLLKRSRSRSEKKLQLGKSLNRQYKSFVKKLRRGGSPDPEEED